MKFVMLISSKIKTAFEPKLMKRTSIYFIVYSNLRSAKFTSLSVLLALRIKLDCKKNFWQARHLILTSLILLLISSQAHSSEKMPQTSSKMRSFGIEIPTFTYLENQQKKRESKDLSPQFSDVTALYGISSLHSYRSSYISSIQEAISAAVCVFDANNDHFLDILTIGGGGSQREFGRVAWWSINAKNKLYINASGKGFDELDPSLFSSLAGKSMNCAAADLDNDNDIDIVITTTNGHYLFENMLNNRSAQTVKKADINQGLQIATTELFAPAKKIAGIDENDYPVHALLSDIDGDGDIDIYSSHFIKYQRGSRTAQMSQGFDGLTKNEFRAELFDSIPNKLLLNESNLQFKLSEQFPTLNSGIGRSIASQIININHDAYPDLLVLNSFDSRSRIFIGSQSGYQEASGEFSQFSVDNMQGFAQSQLQSRSSFIGKVNPEIAYISRAAGNKNILKQRVNNSTHWQVITASETDKSNALFRSDWSALIRDFDLNSYPDIFVAAGMTKTSLDSKHVMLGQNNQVYWGGETSYSTVAEDPHLLSQSSRGAAAIDIDNDGVSELLIANNNGSVRLLKMKEVAKQNWLGFSLPSQSDWLHATLQVRSEDGEFHVYQNLHPQSTFSQHDPRIVMPVKSDPPYHLIVEKRNGSKLEFSLDKANSYFSLSNSGSLQAVPKVNPRLSELALGVAEPMSPNLQLALQKLDNSFSGDIDPQTQKSRIFRLSSNFDSMKLVINKYWREFDAQTQFWLWDMLILDPQSNSFEALLSDQNKKQQVIDLLSSNAINANQEELIYEAINYQYQSENEQGLDWLLPLINSENQELVCDLATIFKHYFVEEEAVFLRKQTAVPFLMRALNKPDVSVSVQDCILAAIGESENQRASPQLLKMLNGDPSRQALVVRTMGQLRDSRAISAIANIFMEEQDPLLLAEALIAMERLVDSNTPARLSALQKRLSSQAYWQMLAAISRSEDVVTFSSEVVNGLDSQLTDFVASKSLKGMQGVRSETALAQIAVASHRGLKPRLLKAYSQHSSAKVRTAFLLFAMQYDLSAYDWSLEAQQTVIANLDEQTMLEWVDVADYILSNRPFLSSNFSLSLLEGILNIESTKLLSSENKTKLKQFLKHFSPQDKSTLLVKLGADMTKSVDVESSPTILGEFAKWLDHTDFDWPYFLNSELGNEQAFSVLSLWYLAPRHNLYSQESQLSVSAKKELDSASTNSKIQLLLNKTLVSIDVQQDKLKALMLMRASAQQEPEIVLGSLMELQKKLSLEELVSVAGEFSSEFLSSNKKLKVLISSLLNRAVNADKFELIEQLLALSNGVSLRTRRASNRSFIYVP
jgi:hypothetical protein